MAEGTRNVKIKSKPVGPDYRKGFNDGYEKGLEDAYKDASRVLNALWFSILLLIGFFALYFTYQPQ